MKMIVIVKIIRNIYFTFILIFDFCFDSIQKYREKLRETMQNSLKFFKIAK